MALFAATGARGAENADTSSDHLLNLFIQKGYVSKEEADKVKAEDDFDRTNSLAASLPPSKWIISKAMKSVELFGDIRLRYEDREAKDPTGGKIALDRMRYAVRFGLRGDVFDDFYYGLRFETSSNPRSSWVTFGTSSSGAPYQGPFGKSTATLGIGQVYLGWRQDHWLDITLGKMPNPLYTTPMVWSSSINPEGAAETLKYTVGQADLFATFGQFIYEDTNPNQTSSGYFGLGSGNLYGGNGTIPLMLAFQAGGNYHVSKKVSIKVAPVIYLYTGVGADTAQSTSLVTPGFSDTFIGQGTTGGPSGFSGYPFGYYDGYSANQTGINDLMVLEVPLEVNVKLSHFNLRFFGDYAYNLDGSTRAKAAYNAISGLNKGNTELSGYPIQPISSPQTQDVTAYQVGFGIGSTNLVYGPMQGLVYGSSSAKHAWEFRSYWQHVEQYSLDPNLPDTDFFEGSENLEGVYAALSYSPFANVIATVRYGYASRINNKLGTGGSGQDIPQMNPINTFSIFQLDLGLKF
jgi:hypothetical protein